MIHPNCFISCDTFKLLYVMRDIHTVLYHVIHVKKKCSWLLFYYNHSSFLFQERQSQYLFILQCDAFKLFHTMWYLQAVLDHVIPSSWFIPCDTFKLCYAMWYLQTVLYHAISSNCLYHVIPTTNLFSYHVILSICVIPCDAFKTVVCHVILLICFITCDIFNLYIPCDTFKLFIPYDTFKLFYAMWYL